MDKILLVFWSLTETATMVLLIRGGPLPNWIIGFLAVHVLTVLLTYAIFNRFVKKDSRLRKGMWSKGFLVFLGAVSIVPVTGPPVSLSIIFYLRFFSVVPVRTESFKQINQNVLVNLQKKLQSRTIPITEALLIHQLKREDALRMLGVIDEMDWTATKSGILRYVIRLCPYQNILLVAIDVLKKKTDAIFSEIGKLESDPDRHQENLRVLANLYHEICYLDLCEPVMKQIYLEKACDYAMRNLKANVGSGDDALLAVRYLLEAGRVEDANQVYNRIRNSAAYHQDKWIPYAFELSVRRTDMAMFNTLYPLIESTDGVYVPAKVKKAARAWKKMLTSAWS